MKARDILIRVVRKLYLGLTGTKFLNPKCDIDRSSANEKIYNLLVRDEPCMISRFGSTEINCINNYISVESDINYVKKIINFITDNSHTPWWNKSHFKTMSIYSGIFPPSVETSEKFSQRYLEDIPLIDILGSFQYHEKFMPLKEEVQKVQLETLYPFFVDNPWTRALKGKKVLVVHPFDQSIESQYKKRELLFENKDILPDYELITLKAVQSVAGNKVPFKSWFEALEFMENQISDIDFDICILGCGAYGMPLAAHVKRIGKKSIHIGGGTQLLFGIKGKRWTEVYSEYRENRTGEIIFRNYRLLFNEHWCFPEENEKPKNADKVEGACYW